MYFLIDRERLVVLHKHLSFSTVAALAELEIPDNAYAVTALDDARRLYTYTEMELGGLYRNLTGQEPGKVQGNSLRKLILEACHRLPETQASEAEVERQAEWALKHTESGPYQYVKGASRPARSERPGLTTAPASDPTAILAAWAPPAPVQAPAPAQHATTERQHAPRATSTSASPRGATTATVWQVADELWQQAGTPTDKAVVLKLRKSMMEILERDHGIIRNTSSNALAGWQKARLPA